jgi:hypothetical protein
MPSCSPVRPPDTFQFAIGTMNCNTTASRCGSGADGCSCRLPRFAERQEAWLTAPRQRTYLSILRLSMEMRHSHDAQPSRVGTTATCHYQSSALFYWTSLLKRRRACGLQPFDPKVRRGAWLGGMVCVLAIGHGHLLSACYHQDTVCYMGRP